MTRVGAMSSKEIRLEQSADGRLAQLKIERSPVNVLRVSDLEKVAAQLAELRNADVLVLSGLPRAFSAGVDLADHAPEAPAIDRLLLAMRAFLQRLLAAPPLTSPPLPPAPPPPRA